MKIHKNTIKRIGILALTSIFFFTSFSYGADSNQTVQKLSLQEAKKMALQNKFNKSQMSLQKDKLSLQEDGIYTNLNNASYGQTRAKGAAAALDEQRRQVLAELAILIDKEMNNPPLSDLEKAQKSALQTQLLTIESQLSGLSSAVIGDQSNPLLDSLESIRISQKALQDSEEVQDLLLAYNVEMQYISLLSLEKQIKSLEKNILNMEKVLKLERIKNNLGLSSNIALENIFFTVNQLKNTLEQAKIQKENSYANFKKFIGYPLHEAIVLEDFKLENFLLPNYEEGLKRALENGVEIRNAKSEVSRREGYIENMKDRYPKGAAALDSPKLDLKDAQLKLEEKMIKTELSYKTAYNDLLVKKQKLDLAMKDMNLARKAYEIEKLKYEVGMSSKLEHESKQTDYELKQIALQQAEYEYMKSLAAYEMASQGVIISLGVERE
ncbi:TolC family protein [Thermotalea metallivorans]|uniref:Outer membrane efflux protein n=1 Tax=Thermotalea metallivorans TaxID=520762 RepID=A0A140L6Q4_9FIRM|nr:TolC family protein [Thermotalea metallivorans]KXG76229.1 hypothetical protein AN619_11860 [Thermotalea metallivorans]